ncbi:MAG: 50S ribosomal protein L18 [Nitrospinae bacterium]|nr:50S ribosomal protein L18 [Nitrospinota bacterium]
MGQFSKRRRFERRKVRVRKRVQGTLNRPRLNVSRSNAHIYAQIIDDTLGRTLASASSLDPGLRSQLKSGSTREAAKAVGQLLAERAKVVHISTVVFDRGGRLYHGRVKALAEASRGGGLQF